MVAGQHGVHGVPVHGLVAPVWCLLLEDVTIQGMGVHSISIIYYDINLPLSISSQTPSLYHYQPITEPSPLSNAYTVNPTTIIIVSADH